MENTDSQEDEIYFREKIINNGKQQNAQICPQLFLDQDADINALSGAKGGVQTSALSIATANGTQEVVKMLVSRSAIDLNLRDENNNTPLMVAIRTFNVAGCGKEEEKNFSDSVKILIHAGADVHAVNNEGKSALHYALERGLYFVTDLLMPENHNDMDPYFLSAVSGFLKLDSNHPNFKIALDTIQQLYHKGANLEAVNEKKKTLFYNAIIKKKYDHALQVLRMSADPDIILKLDKSLYDLICDLMKVAPKSYSQAPFKDRPLGALIDNLIGLFNQKDRQLNIRILTSNDTNLFYRALEVHDYPLFRYLLTKEENFNLLYLKNNKTLFDALTISSENINSQDGDLFILMLLKMACYYYDPAHDLLIQHKFHLVEKLKEMAQKQEDPIQLLSEAVKVKKEANEIQPQNLLSAILHAKRQKGLSEKARQKPKRDDISNFLQNRFSFKQTNSVINLYNEIADQMRESPENINPQAIDHEAFFEAAIKANNYANIIQLAQTIQGDTISPETLDILIPLKGKLYLQLKADNNQETLKKAIETAHGLSLLKKPQPTNLLSKIMCAKRSPINTAKKSKGEASEITFVNTNTVQKIDIDINGTNSIFYGVSKSTHFKSAASGRIKSIWESSSKSPESEDTNGPQNFAGNDNLTL